MNSQSSQQRTETTVFVVPHDGHASFSIEPDLRIDRQIGRLGMVRSENAAGADLLLDRGCLFSDAVLNALVTAPPGTVLKDNLGRVAAIRSDGAGDHEARFSEPAPATAVSGVELAGRYDQKLRKQTDPMVLRPATRDEAEKALFAASYKGVTDLVTKHAWPVPALAVTRWCAAKGITPNQVTWASAALVGVAFWLFWIGAFLPGLAAAYAMTFLDTVDGKLARVTLTSSRFGDVLDHGIDLIHPPFWWWAWAVGCAAIGTPLDDGGLALICIVGGYILQRAEEGFFIARFGIEMHIWKRFDSVFRQVTARRNPNLLILTVAALVGAPREGLILVATWTVICLFVHLFRICLALVDARRAPLNSWLAEH